MAKDYQVGNPRLDTIISDYGSGFSKMWVVPYTVTDGAAAGTRGHVEIPAESYDADTVHRAIREAVDMHHAVMGR